MRMQIRPPVKHRDGPARRRPNLQFDILVWNTKNAVMTLSGNRSSQPAAPKLVQQDRIDWSVPKKTIVDDLSLMLNSEVSDQAIGWLVSRAYSWIWADNRAE